MRTLIEIEAHTTPIVTHSTTQVIGNIFIEMNISVTILTGNVANKTTQFEIQVISNILYFRFSLVFTFLVFLSLPRACLQAR